MTESSEQRASISSILKSTGLPTTLKGKVQRWLVRLVGGTIGAPVVRHSRQVWDQIEGQSRVNVMIAEEVGRRAISNPGLMERAEARFLSDVFKDQENLEAIAHKTAELLQNCEDILEDSMEEIDDDWINIFSRYAKEASSDRMRVLWAQIMSGKIRNISTFSPRTLRVVSEIDQLLASDFQRLAKMAVHDSVLKTKEFSRGDLFEVVSRLETAGLVTGGLSAVNREYVLPKGRHAIFRVENLFLVLDFSQETTVIVDYIMLTESGKELLSIQELGDPEFLLTKISEEFQRKGAIRATLEEPIPEFPNYLKARKLLFGDINAPVPT